MSERIERLTQVSLKLRVGELTVAALNRRMLLRTTNPFGREADRDGLGVTLEDVPDEAHGVLIPSQRVLSRLPKVSLYRSWIRYVPRQYDRHYADLSTTYEAYLDRFSSKSRSSLRRKARKFEERSGGSICWKCYTTTDEIAEFYRLAREISQQSYQERLLDAGLPEDEQFYASMIESAKVGAVRGYLIFLDGTPVAYLYCPIRDAVVSYAYLGYRAEFSELSPGTVLLWLVMEDLFREGAYKIFDFTEGGDRGRHRQKRLFSTATVACADIYVFRPTTMNLVAVGAHATVEWLSTSIGAALDRIGLKRALKSWTRTLRRA